MKIAITTKDGQTVNEHFGKADMFYIYEKSDNKIDFIEKREVQSYCANTNGIADDPNHKFSVDRLELVYDKIKDCKVLYTQKIGDVPMEKLSGMGMKIQLCNCPIDSLPECSGNCK